MFLLASAITVLAIYGSYIEREKGYMSRRIEDIMPPGSYLVKDDPKMNPKAGVYVSLVAGWRKETVPTNYGDLPITFLDFSGTTHSALPLIPPGSASFHSAVASRYGIEEGDLLMIPWGGRIYELVVKDVASELTMDGTGLGGRNILVSTGEQQMNTRFLYRKRFEHVSEATIIRAITYDHMRGVITTSVGGATVGSAMVNANYNAITQSKLILVIFLSIAFLTAKLLGYLESRKMLAILKALGMKGKEVAGTFAAEALIAPALGMFLGGAVSTAILYSLSKAGVDMSPSLSVIVVAIWLVVPAIIFGIIIPATVNSNFI